MAAFAALFELVELPVKIGERGTFFFYIAPTALIIFIRNDSTAHIIVWLHGL